jgi:hypothetical protein
MQDLTEVSAPSNVPTKTKPITWGLVAVAIAVLVVIVLAAVLFIMHRRRKSAAAGLPVEKVDVRISSCVILLPVEMQKVHVSACCKRPRGPFGSSATLVLHSSDVSW